MNESNSMEAIDRANLTEQTKFRLDEISKIQNYFQEINQIKSCSKKLSKYVAVFDYIDKVFNFFECSRWWSICNFVYESCWCSCRNSKHKFYFNFVFSNRNN